MKVIEAKEIERVIKILSVRSKNTRDDIRVDTYNEAIDLLQEVLNNGTERDT